MRKYQFDRHLASTEKLDGVEQTPQGYRAELDRLAELEAKMPDYGSRYSPQALLEHRRGLIEQRLAASMPEGYDVAAGITARPDVAQLRAVATALRAFPTAPEAVARPGMKMPKPPKPAPRAQLTPQAQLRRRP
jgi:hypothetical protein